MCNARWTFGLSTLSAWLLDSATSTLCLTASSRGGPAGAIAAGAAVLCPSPG